MFAEFRGGGAGSAPSKYVPAVVLVFKKVAKSDKFGRVVQLAVIVTVDIRVSIWERHCL